MSINSWNQPAPRTHYFTLPNEIFSLHLCPGELAIYAYLLYLENRRTHKCYPSYRTISAAVGIHSKNTVKKYVDMLEEKRRLRACRFAAWQVSHLWYGFALMREPPHFCVCGLSPHPYDF